MEKENHKAMEKVGAMVSGEGLSEAELKEIYEIYQEQQKIRQELEKQLENLINAGDRKLGEKTS